MPLPELQLEERRQCPQCEQLTAEPEHEGDYVCFACQDPACGAVFGHVRIRQDPACAAGFSGGALPAAPASPVFVGATIRRRPE